MKTVAFLVFLILAVPWITLPTAAQNTVKVEQEGYGNIASIDQSEAVDSGVVLDQVGGFTLSTLIRQEGGNQQANFKILGEGHETTTTQLGGVNKIAIDVSGLGNIVYVFQDGFFNKAQFFQSNSLNESITYQLQSNNEASIDQRGNSNSGRIIQHGNENAYLVQVGDQNRAIIDQSGEGNTLTLKQQGVNNHADIEQTFGFNDLILDQRGDDFVGKVSQSGSATASVTQIGAGFEGVVGGESGTFATSVDGSFVPAGLIGIRQQ